MNKLDYLKLTQAVYRVTEFFPEGEPLKFKIREKANEILTDLILLTSTQNNPQPTGLKDTSPVRNKISNGIEVLDNYFEVARVQNWLNPLNFLVLSQEYSKIRDELKNLSETQLSEVEPPKVMPRRPIERRSGQARHQKILEVLKEKGQVQVWEIKKILPEISKRTLRRDFDTLLKQGLIERIGEKNNTSYHIK